MKVVLVSSQALPTPPPKYGGLERIVYWLSRELIKMGHEVYLIAKPGSRIEGGVLLEGTGDEVSTFRKYESFVKQLIKDGEAVVHSHEWLYAFGLLRMRGVPCNYVLHTHHGAAYNWPSPPPFEKPNLMGISRHHALLLEAEMGIPHKYVYHGVPLEEYELYEGPREKWALFLNRATPEKGAHIAVWIAKKTGVKLKMISGGSELYGAFAGYAAMVAQRANNYGVEWLGEVDDVTKKSIMSRACCVISTATFEEPFGLFAVEAMAVGTPVVALARGALPEIIKHKKTGLLSRNLQEFAEHLNMVSRGVIDFNPRSIRQYVESHFSAKKMAENYLSIYKDVLNGNCF
ncbi:MAG: glycosyltransferase [Thermoproteus sp.]|nr:glycosyltransferase [Thermoproteus sp.]